MNYDFAIVYWGLMRTIKKTHQSQLNNIFKVLDENNITYKTFMHTWKLKNNKQHKWNTTITKEIDYDEYKLLPIDFFKIQKQQKFLETLNIEHYYYKQESIKHGQIWWGDLNIKGESPPRMIINYLCALESQKRALLMVEKYVKKGNKFKYVMFIRPDAKFENKIPIRKLNVILEKTPNNKNILIPNFGHFGGFNDRFAITHYNEAYIYGKRIDELANYRKIKGRLHSETYLKYIIDKHNLNVNLFDFNFDLMRP